MEKFVIRRGQDHRFQTMKLIATFLLLISLRCAIAEEQVYSTKYDGINLEEILTNDRLLSSYVNCLLDIGPCTADGKELKNNVPDAIQNDCQKCSERQREGADQVLEYIIDNKPDDWEKLEKKYSSDGRYKMKYLERKQTQERSLETTVKPDDENLKSNEKE